MTVQSYNGNLDFGFIACRELVPDLWSMTDLLQDSMQELLDAASRSPGRSAEASVEATIEAAIRSAIITVGRWVLARGASGITDASHTTTPS